jgi:isocitrate lyase
MSFRAVKHQSFVGAGYFDAVQTTVTGGDVSTSAMKGSTEEQQFGAH